MLGDILARKHRNHIVVSCTVPTFTYYWCDFCVWRSHDQVKGIAAGLLIVYYFSHLCVSSDCHTTSDLSCRIIKKSADLVT